MKRLKADGTQYRGRGQGGLIKKRGSENWYALFWQNGRQYTVSTGTSIKKVAEGKLREMLGRRDQNQVPTADLKKIKYEELREALIAEYKINGRKSLRFTAKDKKPYLSNLPPLDKFFEGWRAISIGPDAIRKFVLERQDAECSNASINRALSALKRMFVLAVRDGKLQNAPHIALLKEPPARKGFLELEAFRKLRGELPDYMRAPVTMAFFTGMRLGEISRLTWQQVDLKDRTLNLNPGETKNDEARIIPLNSETVQMLKMLPRDQEFVFGQPLGQFRKSWRNACVRAELGKFEKLENGAVVYNGLTFHDLRRSGVRNLIRAGVSEQVAMKISGHKTTSIFRRYNIISGADLRDAAKKLDSYVRREESRFDDSLMETAKLQ